jgi:hypothetical protein
MSAIIGFLSEYLIYILALGAVVALAIGAPPKRRKLVVGFAVLAALTTFLAAQITHLFGINTIPHYEMCGIYDCASNFSKPVVDSTFPSDVIALAFSAAFAVLFLTKNRKISLAFVGAAILVSLGQIMSVSHSAVDALGSIGCAVIGALWYVVYHRVVSSRGSKK